MTFNFVEKVMCIGGNKDTESAFQFYKKGFVLGGNSGSTPSWQDIILSGNTALTLVNAKANGLNYVKLFGACEQNGTPSPDTPVDIVSNNGALKVSYQLLTNGNCANNTDNWALGLVSYDNTDDYIAFTNNTANYAYIRCNTNGSRIANHTYAYLITGKTETGTASWGSRNAGSAETVLQTTEQTLGFVDTFPEDGSGEPWINIRAGNTFMLNKKSGFRMFDLTALGLDTVITTPEQAIDYFGTTYRDPKEVYTDGTVETVGVCTSKDITDELTKNYFISDNGTISGNNGSSYSNNIPVDIGTKYEFVCATNGAQYLRIHGYDSGGNWVQLLAKSELRAYSISVTVPNGIKYIRYSGYDTDVTLNTFNGGSATAEMLLSVGDYQDEQEVLTGAVTRNVGVKVLDGSESWVRSEQSGFIYVDNLIQFSINAPLCSHYLGTTSASASGSNKIRLAMSGSNYRTIIYASLSDYPTVEDFQQYLADQYAAGTPVTVVYPLAEPTTESVAGQALTTQAGTNIVEITQASIDNLALEVSYKGKQTTPTVNPNMITSIVDSTVSFAPSISAGDTITISWDYDSSYSDFYFEVTGDEAFSVDQSTAELKTTNIGSDVRAYITLQIEDFWGDANFNQLIGFDQRGKNRLKIEMSDTPTAYVE